MKLIKNKKDKKAWLKIIESVIAILIVIGGVMYIISNYAQSKDISANVYEKEKYILNAISKDTDLRSKIITSDQTVNNYVNSYIQNLIPYSWDFETRICEIQEICGITTAPNDKDIYASETVITSVLTDYNPKKLRLFIWEK